MKKINLLLMITLLCLLVTAGARAQSGGMTLIGSIGSDGTASRMVWDASGDRVTIVTDGMIYRYPVDTDGNTAPAGTGQSVDFKSKSYTLTDVSNSGVMAALSSDRQSIIIYEEPMNEAKAVRTIEPGFMMLSVAVSNDGSNVLADSAEEIRTVVYDTANGDQVYDLGGFSTAAPVYDSVLSGDGSHVVWHSRGTFAVQDAETGTFGKTVSLWDFASSYDLSPDNQMLAVGIINDDYESGAVLFFDPQSGTESGRTLFGKTAPQELAYSADGSVLMAADGAALYRIDPQSFEVLDQVMFVAADAEDLRISRIAPSADGSLCAVLLSSGKVYVVKNRE